MTAPLSGAAPAPPTMRFYNATDKWGRLWLVATETVSGGLTGCPTPAGWADPLHTPPKYLQLDPTDPHKLVPDYEGWAVELEYAWKDWQARYEELGFDKYGEKFNPDDSPPPYMIRMVGKPPMDPKIPRAAAAGDPKWLGVTPKVSAVDAEVAALRAKVAELEAKKHPKVAETVPVAEDSWTAPDEE